MPKGIPLAPPTKRGLIVAIIVLMMLLPALSSFAQTWPQLGGRSYQGDASWNFTNYWIESQATSTGWFKNGQYADLELAGFGFNNASGPLTFDQPSQVASDGTHLLLADTNNNRILIWNTLPASNVAPDLVLGQQNFTSNNSGNGMNQMDWPNGISTDGTHLVVADTANSRVLIWNTFPTKNGQPADIVIDCCQWFGQKNGIPNPAQNWPWAVWTNGTKLIVTSTSGGYLFFWNHFPTYNNQPPDQYTTGAGKLGTPRGIATNGHDLIITDENAKLSNGGNTAGVWFWKTFPVANDTPPDFLLGNPNPPAHAFLGNNTFWGTFLPDGRFVAAGSMLYIWNQLPQNGSQAASLAIGNPCDLFYVGYYRWCSGGSHPSVVYAGGRLYVADGTASKIAVFNSIPTNQTQVPDFAIGASSASEDTRRKNSLIDNPDIYTDGQRLWAISNGQAEMYLWKNIPDQSGAVPDMFYDDPNCPPQYTIFGCNGSNLNGFSPFDGSISGGKFVAAGFSTVWIWNSVPNSGQLPDEVFHHNIGNATFNMLHGAAMDGKYFYLADIGMNKVWIWNGIPDSNATNPVITLNVTDPWTITTDGNYLVISQIFQDQVSIYPVASLANGAQPIVVTLSGGPEGDKFPGVAFINGAEDAIAADGHLFIADGGNDRVVAWKSIQDALSGKPPDTVLGQPNLLVNRTSIGSNGGTTGPSGLFLPAYLSWDGTHLWVGEMKFHDFVYRYTLPSNPGPQAFNLSVDGDRLSVQANTADTLSDLAFNPSLKAICYSVNATAAGVTTLIFPDDLLNGSLTATLDGTVASPTISQYNSTFTSVKVSYASGFHQVKISGTNALISKSGDQLAFSIASSSLVPPKTSFDASTLATPEPISVTAALTPSISDGNLTIEYRRQTLYSYCGYCEPPGPWTKIGSSTPQNGMLSAIWTPPMNGTYDIRAIWSGDSNYEPSRSETYTVQVLSSATASLTTSTTFTSQNSTSVSTTLSSTTSTTKSTVSSTSSFVSSSSTTNSVTTSSTTTSYSTTSTNRGTPDSTYALIGVVVVAVIVVGSYLLVKRKKPS